MDWTQLRNFISLHHDVGGADIHLNVTFNSVCSPVSSNSPGIQIASTSDEVYLSEDNSLHPGFESRAHGSTFYSL